MKPNSLSRGRAQGFTLIEIMIVVFIIGLAASLMALSVGDSKADDPARKEAQLLLQALDFVSEQAALNGEMFGMFVHPRESDGSLKQEWCYSWQQMRMGKWSPLPDDTLKEHCMPDNIAWDLEVEGKLYNYDPELETQPPVLVFASSGEATGVDMSIYESGTGGTPGEVQHITIGMMGDIHWLNQEEADKQNAQQ